MYGTAKEIQHKWNYENGDYVYDTIDGGAGVGIGITQKIQATVSGFINRISFNHTQWRCYTGKMGCGKLD